MLERRTASNVMGLLDMRNQVSVVPECNRAVANTFPYWGWDSVLTMAGRPESQSLQKLLHELSPSSGCIPGMDRLGYLSPAQVCPHISWTYFL